MLGLRLDGTVRLEHFFSGGEHIIHGITAVNSDLSHRSVDTMEGEVDFEEVFQREPHVLIEPAAKGDKVEKVLTLFLLHKIHIYLAKIGFLCTPTDPCDRVTYMAYCGVAVCLLSFGKDMHLACPRHF